jgi:hypothetical protein
VFFFERNVKVIFQGQPDMSELDFLRYATTLPRQLVISNPTTIEDWQWTLDRLFEIRGNSEEDAFVEECVIEGLAPDDANDSLWWSDDDLLNESTLKRLVTNRAAIGRIIRTFTFPSLSAHLTKKLAKSHVVYCQKFVATQLPLIDIDHPQFTVSITVF